MRTEILQLKDLGRMPNESINDPDSIVEVIRSYDELLERIQLPISFDEAEVLVQIFPESSFCKRLSKYIFYSSFSLLTFATKK